MIEENSRNDTNLGRRFRIVCSCASVLLMLSICLPIIGHSRFVYLANSYEHLLVTPVVNMSVSDGQILGLNLNGTPIYFWTNLLDSNFVAEYYGTLLGSLSGIFSALVALAWPTRMRNLLLLSVLLLAGSSLWHATLTLLSMLTHPRFDDYACKYVWCIFSFMLWAFPICRLIREYALSICSTAKVGRLLVSMVFVYFVLFFVFNYLIMKKGSILIGGTHYEMLLTVSGPIVYLVNLGSQRLFGNWARIAVIVGFIALQVSIACEMSATLDLQWLLETLKIGSAVLGTCCLVVICELTMFHNSTIFHDFRAMPVE